MKDFTVDESDLVVIDRFDLEKMLASEKKRENNMKLPGELTIGFYRRNRTEELHIA